ncbi:aldehyde dehydrogenase (NADP(+)) [Sediminivirga luteola]|uniref:aldehyde dehydrogenase (NADP(+)) n=1 Tax=Sediminivirga luteola TaxID=1774748 RepID=UPI001F58BD57|nr:aldehyde dehydrogenase (NADP(+)) [Sediminivirga luteola]MCI2266282.1 aldehyde dehydrogenase (NADP(+)) [Sediminivirga luteola]
MATTAPAFTGHSLIAGQPAPGEEGTVTGFDPATDEALEPAFSLLSDDQLRAATAAAEEAFESFSALAPEVHAAFIESIAANMEAAGEQIVERAMAESGLTRARLTGELARTTGQLRLFASVVRQGDHRGVRIDPALPERTPLPRPDIRQRMVPLGPVAVFGASNFPLAFSTAGGDTASAFAAGCPVVVKAHNAHPGTSDLVAQAITAAVQQHDLHPGVFSHVYGPGAKIGQALVADPAIKAVGFTGSRGGGLALAQVAASRPEPIPVYAEMSSINPVILLPGALAGGDAIDALAQGYAGSLTGSSGQLCTAPGLVFVPAGEQGDAFEQALARILSEAAGQTMLTKGIAEAWTAGATTLGEQAHVERIAQGTDGATCNAPAPVVFRAGAQELIGNPVLHREIFGSASLVVRYSSTEELARALSGLEGQLTATLHLESVDHEAIRELLPLLERKAGRIIVGGWPTGVDVGHAIVHGGPFPATSDARTTSVGSLAIDRFLRPVAYQNVPDALLPEPLKEGNPWGLSRRIDGRLTPPEG